MTTNKQEKRCCENCEYITPSNHYCPCHTPEQPKKCACWKFEVGEEDWHEISCPHHPFPKNSVEKSEQPKATGEKEAWSEQRKTLQKLVKIFPNLLMDSLDAAYLKGLEDTATARCTKCGSPFLEHHHKHITRTRIFHTECYNKSGFKVVPHDATGECWCACHEEKIEGCIKCKCAPTHSKDWEAELSMIYPAAHGALGFENIKSFIASLLETEREKGYELRDKEYGATLSGVIDTSKKEGAAETRDRILSIVEGMRKELRDGDMSFLVDDSYNAALDDLTAKIKEDYAAGD